MRYLITGGSGYIGGRLVEYLGGLEETEKIVVADLRPPAVSRPKSSFVKLDVREGERLRQILESERIDVLVHLAFILNPIRDEGMMYDVDVNGTQAVLRAASLAGIEQVLVTTSGVAYGAFPDNPKPITEEWPVRGVPDFSYARDKTESDRVCQLWAAQHPERTMTIVRPCIVYGPNVDNYLFRIWKNLPEFPLLDGSDEEVQYVHEDDVVSAVVSLLEAKAPGAFNVCGDGTMRWSECAKLVGKPVRVRSFRGQYFLMKWAWRLRVPQIEAPAGNLKFARYSWVMSNEKLKQTTGWKPAHTTRETFEITMRAKGLWQGGPPAAASASSTNGAAPAAEAEPAEAGTAAA